MGMKETKKNGRVYLSDEKTGQRAGSRPLPVSADPAALLLVDEKLDGTATEIDLTAGIDSAYEAFARKQAERQTEEDAIVEAYTQARTAYDEAAVIASKRFEAYKDGYVSKENYTDALAVMHRAKFAAQNTERKYQETAVGQQALQDTIDHLPDGPAREKAETILASARTRVANREASEAYMDKGEVKTAQVVLTHGAEYAWASEAEFDLREAVFTPHAVTRSGTETDTNDNGDMVSREKIETFLHTVPLSTGPNLTNPNMTVTVYGVPSYSEAEGDRLVVIAETSPVVSNYTVGTLTKDGALHPRQTDVLARFMENERGPVSEHTRNEVDDWSYHVTSRNHQVTGLAITAFTTWEQADPNDFRDSDRNDDY